MDIFGLSMESDVVEELALKLYGELEKIICDNDPMMFSNLIFLISNTLEQLNNRIVREKELNEKIQVVRDENEELLRKFRNRGVIIEDKDRVILQYQSEIENFHHEKELLTIDSRLMKKKINDLNKKIKELEVLVDSFESENYYKEEKLKAMERELEKKVINYRNTTVKNQKNIFNNNSSEEKPMFPVLKSHISEDISNNKLVLSNSETNHNHLNSAGSSPISEYIQVSSNSDLENIELDFNPGANLCVVSDEQLNSELTTKAVNVVSKVTYEQSNSQSDTIVAVVSNGQSNSELTNEQSNSELDTIVGVVSNELSNYKLDSSVVSDVINEQSNSELDTSVVDVVSSEQSNHKLDSIVSVASDVTNKQSNSELDTIVSEVASDPTIKQSLSASEKPNHSMLNISIFADATGKELSQLLKKHFSNNCNIMSLVKSNASFLQVVNSCRPECYAKNDHVVLIFGVTDIDLRRECDIFMKLEPYLTLFGGTNVWLCTLPYRFDLEANDPKQNVIQLINNYMKEIAERLAHVRVIDIYGFRQNNFSRDGVYLNAKGKKKLSGLIYKSIKTVQNQT